MDDKGCRKTPSLRVQTAPGLADELVPFLGRKITQDGNLDANREVDSSAVNCPEKKTRNPLKSRDFDGFWLTGFFLVSTKKQQNKVSQQSEKSNKITQTTMNHQQRDTKKNH